MYFNVCPGRKVKLTTWQVAPLWKRGAHTDTAGPLLYEGFIQPSSRAAAAAMLHLPQRVIKGEVQRVIAVLRSHQSTDSRFSEEIPTELESPLLRAFRALYQRLSTAAGGDALAVDAAAYTAPFCAALVAGDVSGVVAGVALAALNKFLLYGFLSADAPGGAAAVNGIVGAATQCRFEPTSAAEDELVLVFFVETDLVSEIAP